MKTKFSVLKAPCQEEPISQLSEILEYALAYTNPIFSNIVSITAISSMLEWENLNPNTVFVIAQTESSVIGFAQGFMVNANRAPGYLRGNSARSLGGDEYFYLKTVAVLPWFQKKGIGKRLVEQIVEIQTCQTVLLQGLKDSVMSRLVMRMGGKIEDTKGWNTFCFMTLPVKK